ncbi:phage tail family protein [Staphylococcus hominis]|uniref:phage tail domain-containing protein n=1 Tax=Staphylococcus hominis TaxID=1290 RepID=UPI00287A8675|nr:phage tail domain-containing protein [Staphylococcus hominis]MDS3887028.1 phage tail family protein [Staphylococcus hominis]MDS3887093.1 phage tail family protein [Staphylococcus hominis]
MPFTIFDPNMNKIDYPVGVTPLDFLVSAIEKERYIETVNGIPGNVNYGFDYKEREVTLNFWLRHYHGEHDQKLLRSELYAMLDSQPYFYVSDDKLPTRALKLAIDEPYLPERINGSNISTLEIKCQIIDLPFWQTKYTTQDIETNGYEAVIEKFGLADGINIDYPRYTFTESEFSLWNGGNVDIDPRNIELLIQFYNLKTEGTFTITNLTTGEKHVLNKPFSGNHYLLSNAKAINASGVNYLRDTNRKFISLAKGLNKFRIENGIFDRVIFDFKFHYL